MRAEVAPFTTQATAERVVSELAAAGSSAAQGLQSGTQWVLRPDVEVRSAGTLTVGTAWALPAAEGAAGSAAVRAGGASLTLRAAGDLKILGSITSGLVAPPDSNGAAVSTWVPEDRAAGHLRFSAGTGSLVLGNPVDATANKPPELRLATSTGRIELAAAQDITLAHAGVAVYTTGVAAEPAGTVPDALASGQLLGLVPQGDSGSYLSPWLTGGGAVSLQAGADIHGVAAPATQPAQITQWWWRGSTDDLAALWWSRFDRFTAGIATFGGGDVRVRAGGSVNDLSAAAANSGWMPLQASQGSWSTRRYGGGSVQVQAGADILSGSYFASGATLELKAEGRIGGTAQTLAPELVYQDTAVSAQARGDVQLTRLRSAGQMAPATDNVLGELALTGLDAAASLRVRSAAGDIVLEGRGQLGLQTEFSNSAWTSLGRSLPGRASIGAPGGQVQLDGGAWQVPGADGLLELLALGDVSLGTLTVSAAGAGLPAYALGPEGVATALERSIFSAATGSGARTLDRSSRSVVHVAAAVGSVALQGPLRTARPLRISAGTDILFASTADVQVQHQPQRLDGEQAQAVSELSALVAGRDIDATRSSGGSAGITVAGPGELVMLAGRDINLGASAGVQAIGNQRNATLLPQGGANLTLVAGLRADGQDVAAAVAGSYAFTGSSGLAARPGALYAWLKDGDATLGNAGAAAFEALSTEAEAQAARALVGAPYDAYLLRYLRTALALAQSPDKAAATAASLQAGLLADPRWQPLVQQLQQADGAARPALALALLERSDVRSKVEMSQYLRAVLAQTLESGNAAATLATLGEPLRAAATGAVLAYAYEARPQQARDDFAVRQMQQLLALGAAMDEAQRKAYLATRTPEAQLLLNAEGLLGYLQRTGVSTPAAADALAAFRALPLERQLPWLRQVLRADVQAAGNAAAAAGAGAAFDAANGLGYVSLETLFPWADATSDGRGSGSSHDAGNILMPTSQVRSAQQGDITLLAPSGGVNAGELVPGVGSKKASELGVVTVAGGDIFAAVRDNFEVNQSRVFTLARGDIVLWSIDGNLDAGRGAKSVRGAPAPVISVDKDGNIVLDTAGSFSGSGISTLNAASSVGLFAPRGEINAGEAGIKSAGNITIAAARVVGADNIASGGSYAGTKAEAPSGGATAALGTLGQSASAATAKSTEEDDDERKKRRRRRNLFLDFLGLSTGD